MKLQLYFTNNSLTKSVFSLSDQQEEQIIVRGKQIAAFRNVTGSFQWTRGVRALALLFVKLKLSSVSNEVDPSLIGGSRSYASSLTYSCFKQSLWICDMFGLTRDGTPRARQLLHFFNYSRRIPGPVIVSINNTILKASNVEIHADGALLNGINELLELEKELQLSEYGEVQDCVGYQTQAAA